MEVKKFLTSEEQMEHIENKGFTISDKDKCLNFLKKVNYYNISVYFMLFKDKDGLHKSNVNFEYIYKIYKYDRKICTLIII